MFPRHDKMGTRALTAAVVACPKSVQDQVRQHSSVEGRGTQEPPPLAQELLTDTGLRRVSVL